MAITYTDNGGGAPNGSKLEFTFTFPVIQTEDTKVALNSVVQATTKYAVDLSSNPTKITFNSNNIDPTVQESTGAPKTGVTVRVFRQTIVGKSTGDDAPKAVYAAGSSIRAGDLNANTEQALYAIHELQDQPLTDEFIEDGTVTSAKIKDGTIVNVDVSATAAIDGTKVDPNFGSQNIATSGTINNLTTTELAILDGATVSTTELNKLDGVTATTSELNILDGVTATTTELNYVDGVTSNIQTQIDAKQNTDPELVELSTMSSGTASALADLTQTEVQILDGATVSTTELNKLDGVTSTTAELNILDGVTATASELNILDGVTATASEINKLDGVTASTAELNLTDGLTATTAELNKLDGVTASTTELNLLDGVTATTAELNILDGVTATTTELNIIDGVTATTTELNYVDGVTSNVQTQLNAKQPLDAELTELATMASDTASSLADLTAAEVQTLDGVTATTDEINKLDGVTTSTTELNYVDGVTSNIQPQINNKQNLSARLTTLSGIQSGTASKLADNTALTADLADLNQLDGMAKQTTITNDDTKFPTSGAIVDYVAAQLAPIGGFEVVATDAAFPNTQPASGVVISIADGGGLVVNGSGTSTTGRTIGGSTVTINNFASNFNNTTVDPGVAILVSSTGSGNVYNYHKATLKEADLLSLSGDINDFAERYRVVASEPNTGNDEGDLIYDKSVDKIKVFDSTTNSFKLVDSVGEFKFLFLCPTGSSGTPTLNGSINTYDLREGSSSGTLATVSSAAQLLISIDGVIQKPNTGTSQPSEGFAMVDTNTIVFGSNLVADTQVFIIQIGAEVNIGVPGDNQVSTEKLQNLAVTTNKIADQAVTLDKLPHGTSSNNGKFLRANSGADPTFETISIPAAVGGSDGVDFSDNVKARFGTGNDLSIYHDGSHSFINNATGNLAIRTTTSGSSVGIASAGGEQMASFIVDGAVKLYYDNVKKFETASAGVIVTGNLDFTGNLGAGDNKIIKLGNSADLQIYHDGTESLIKHTGAGVLKIEGNGANNVFLRAKTAENSVTCVPDGGVSLFHNNISKLETTSSGVTVSGHIDLADNNELRLGSADEVRLFHNGSSTSFIVSQHYFNLQANGYFFYNQAGNETLLSLEQNGAVKLYYDNVKKLETTSTGIDVTGNISLPDSSSSSTGRLMLGDNTDIQLYHDSTTSNNYLRANNGYLYLTANNLRVTNSALTESFIKADANGAVELYYDNVKKFETTSGGVDVTGVLTVNGATVTTGGLGNVVEDSTPQLGGDLQSNGNDIDFADNDKAFFGTGNDLSIYYNGSLGLIDNFNGNLHIRNQASSGQIKIQPKSGEDGINVIQDGAVELYYDNAKKLETTSGGARIQGNLELISHLYMGDSDKVLLGNAQDFQMYHDGTSSRIENLTGALTIKSNSNIGLYSYTGTELYAKFIQNGAAELYYDNSKKFETTSSGITVSGDAVINSARVGNWQVNSSYKGLFHNNHSANEYMIISADSATYVSATTGNPVYIRYGNNDTTNQLIIGSGNDALTWRGNKVFHAGNDGAGSGLDADSVDGIGGGSFLRSDANDTFSGDLTSSGSARILLKKTDNNVADHIQFYNGSTRVGEIGCSDNSWLRLNQSTGNNIYTPRYIRADGGFFVDGSSKGINGSGNFVGGTISGASDYSTLIRSNASDNVTGHTEWQDNYHVRLGSGADMRLWHDGSNSYIQNLTGTMNILGGTINIKNDAANETMIEANANSNVRLMYNNSTKLYTTSYGISVGSAGGSVFSGLSNYQAYVGFDTHSSSGFAGVVMGSGPNGNSPFVGASKGGNGSANSFSLYTNGTRRMQIHGSNGNIGAPTAGNNIYNASDERLKENMVELTDGLSKINQIKPYSFTWKSGFDESLEGVTQYGFGAHQTKSVDEILVEPFGVGDIELPNETIENPLRVNEKFIIPMLVKAVQELSAKVETLETKVAALEVK